MNKIPTPTRAQRINLGENAQASQVSMISISPGSMPPSSISALDTLSVSAIGMTPQSMTSIPAPVTTVT